MASDLDPERALTAFKGQRDTLTLVLQSDLPNVASKLCTKSIISRDALAEAINTAHIASVWTVSLLNVVEDRIRAEPHTFTEFVKILESEPTLKFQAIKLKEKYFEGPPGIGKSTLAWELCRRWDRNQYDLAVLLRLRDKEVQQMENVADLFQHDSKKLQLAVAEEVVKRDGEGVLVVLDGFDELPPKQRYKTGKLHARLLVGRSLPKCTVVVTSRPSATQDLKQKCSSHIQKQVEILGFTQECVTEYATSIFSSDTEALDDFLSYVSASENPAINSLMYIPLNAAIVVEIYRTTRKKNLAIP